MLFSLWHPTFDPDVAVPLEVVVGSFPRVPVVSQKSDSWSRFNWYITYSFLIYRARTKYSTPSALYSHPVWVLHSELTDIFPWWRFAPLGAASDRPPCGLFFIRTVGLHHLTLLCRNDMLLFSRLLSRRGPWNEISSCRSVQTGGLGGGGGGWQIWIGIWKTTVIIWVFVSLSFNFRAITVDWNTPHLVVMCPWFPPPALFSNPGR